jgi:hypothetical protein
MTLTDPREALADQSSFISCLVGLCGVARLVRGLVDEPRTDRNAGPADEFVYTLMGLASLGNAIEHLAAPAAARADPVPGVTTQMRWLR